jgi:probable phosphoglycerate mutase
MSLTRIWLARHAESANPTVFHGAESDIELGERGRRQAAAAVAWFREQKPTLVASSAMRRAIETASPTATALGLRHVQVPSFHERRVGSLGGTSFDLAEGPWADTLRHWQSGQTQFTTPGAESFDELRDRLVTTWNTFVREHQGERIVLITHGVVVKVLLLCLLPGWGPTRWSELGRVQNLAVSTLVETEPGGWHAESLLLVPEPVAKVNARLESVGRKSEA